MTYKHLVTIVVGPADEPATIPALVVDWDEIDDGPIDPQEAFFRYALGVPDGARFASLIRESSEEERRRWQLAFDARDRDHDAPFLIHDVRDEVH